MSIQEQRLDAKSVQWFYREALPKSETERLPIVFLHGLPSQSYGWQPSLEALAEFGFHCIAPDWIGFGSSSKPSQRDFAYTPDAFVEALDEFLDLLLKIEQFHLVIQGYLGSAGLQYALRHPDRIQRTVIFNAPIVEAAKIPWRIKQLGLPLAGEMFTQDPLLIDRTLEGGGQYQVEEVDLQVYRRPFLESSAAGRSLFATVRNLKLKAATAEIQQGFRSWEKPVLVAWGLSDPWLPLAQAQQFVEQAKEAELLKLEEVGHYPQQDWPEKVTDAVQTFLRRSV